MIHAQNMVYLPLTWLFLQLLGAAFFFALVGFSSFHLWLASVNKTTLENMEIANRLRPLHSSHSQSNQPPSNAISQLNWQQKRSLEREASRINIFDLGRKPNLYQLFAPVEKKHWGWLGFVLPVGSA